MSAAENATVLPPTLRAFAFAAPAYRKFIATGVAAFAFPLVLVSTPSFGDTAQGSDTVNPVAANGQQTPAPINSESVSCTELKGRLQAAGALTIVGRQGGWGDTFYGPRVPRCEFWQMPVFTYVRATDGLCGVGYICVEKLSFD